MHAFPAENLAALTPSRSKLPILCRSQRAVDYVRHAGRLNVLFLDIGQSPLLLRVSDAGLAQRMGWLGAGVRRPSGEEAAVSRRRAGDVWRGYGDCVLRGGLSGSLVGRDGGAKRQLEAARRVAA